MSTAFYIFSRFLAEQDALDKYYTNMIADFESDEVAYTVGVRIERMQTIECASMLLMGAFQFDTTPEGSDYWFELNEKWEKLAKAEGLM